MNAFAPRLWPFAVWLTLCLAIAGCAPATPASAPSGPPADIGVQVKFFVPVLGTWAVDGFSETLREELAKYRVGVVPDRASPAVTAVITLGDWSDPLGTGRTLIISLVREGRVTLVGHVLMPDPLMDTADVDSSHGGELVVPRGSAPRAWMPADISMNTLDVAAEDVAVVIVRMLRTPSDPSLGSPAAHAARCNPRRDRLSL